MFLICNIKWLKVDKIPFLSGMVFSRFFFQQFFLPWRKHGYSAENQQNSRLTVEIWTLLVVDIFKCEIFFFSTQMHYYFAENQQISLLIIKIWTYAVWSCERGRGQAEISSKKLRWFMFASLLLHNVSILHGNKNKLTNLVHKLLRLHN